MTEEQRLRRKCNRYAKRLVLLGEDDIVWEAEPTPQNTSSNSDYAVAVKNLINSEVDCVQTKNGAYVNLDGVIDCINHALHGFV